MTDRRRIVITGAAGLLGWHSRVRLHAANCAARFRGEPEPFEIVALDHPSFNDDTALQAALSGAFAVLHFAGVNRAPDDMVAAGNPAIAERLAQALQRAGGQAHVVYANSTHSDLDTVYGQSKRKASQILSTVGQGFTNLVLPHIFGESARPFYNNVTATLIAKLMAGEVPQINPEGQVCLFHAGAAAQLSIEAAVNRQCDTVRPDGKRMEINELYAKLNNFHSDYQRNIFPDLSDTFDRDLFNTYRAAGYPDGWPRSLTLNSDARGTLFEAVKGGGGGQCFVSTTNPGITRGDHFHLNKVERFLVLQGEATIRIRKVLASDVREYRVTGENPAPVDMPTMHTHSIENTGSGPLITLFWTHDLFDPAQPDTYSDRVIG